MHFLNRLKYYLIGVGLGILLVLAIFKDRKLTNWTPENQVKKELTEKEMILPANLKCAFNCIGIQSIDSLKSFFETGDIDFHASDVSNHDERKYIIHFEDKNVETVVVKIFEEKYQVSSAVIPEMDCPCPDLLSE